MECEVHFASAARFFTAEDDERFILLYVSSAPSAVNSCFTAESVETLTQRPKTENAPQAAVFRLR